MESWGFEFRKDDDIRVSESTNNVDLVNSCEWYYHKQPKRDWYI